MRTTQPHWAKPRMSLLAVTIAALLSSAAVVAAETASAAAEAKSTADPSEAQGSSAVEPLERIIVKGHRYAPESLTLAGEYNLSRDYLDGLPQGNGNITDMLLTLPGVQSSDSALSADLQGEIRAQLLSISGAQPWQTGFYFNGVNNNSRLDPAASSASPAQINDVQGHPQATFINQSLVDNVTVYDSNVPARFGGFAGGVVDVQPRQRMPREPSVTLSYRGSESSWNQYRVIDERDYNGEDAAQTDSEAFEAPQFSKRTLSLSASTPIGADYALDLALSRTTSTMTEYSLRQNEPTARESVSARLALTSYAWGLDEVRLSATHSPYEGGYLLTDVKDSRFDIEGGGQTLLISARHKEGAALFRSSLSYATSQNSRTAPNVYLPWYRAAGKSWGLNVGEVPFSVEGGYGDIDKEQQTLTWRGSAKFDAWSWGNSDHQLELGLESNYLELSRRRTETGLVYNAPFRDANIDCRGMTLDCIEQTYAVPLDVLAERLGGSIDFANPEHLQAYQENLLTRGQFFQYRRVYPLEYIDVQLQEYAAYLEHNVSLANWEFNLGLRADYDDFLGNLNLAPRLQAGVDIGSARLVVGANRYYSANVLTYKIREQQRGYITQYRSLNNGVVQDWRTSAQAPRYRYSFDNIDTPYSDEATLAWKQRIAGGVFSIKAVQRWRRDLLTRADAIDRDGYTEILQGNEGEGSHQRLTLSYQRDFGRHGLWAHTSFTENESSAESYDDSVDAVPEDEIVFLQTTGDDGRSNFRLLSFDDLTRRQDDFSRPLTATVSLRSDWFDGFSSTLIANYVGTYESAEATGALREISRGDEICSECDINALSYAVYKVVERPARTLLNANFEYELKLGTAHDINLSFEVSNLLNSRTYSVGPGLAGIETGRSFWFGVSYAWR
ncbi:TonB-dependent receptor plug domain-containing protein [Pseudidiomarina insulisalsae]|uniref:Uncharacterized protein n=1 Tax=Pseudidiomarina insulisalsae TaxID=575789 RepID=A0A432YLG2_9GAMM|nr:TonB-dependent receptor plug domain-containing protein [Pseudidiomarina insulisalsae]RUO61804.1 hypothetical protein CWI71_05435 [Pseudidiomarina insulisalsae]